jgi:hypothetical protein
MMSSVRTRSLARVLVGAALLFGAALLSGCSSVIDAIPTAAGGLPENTPARSAVQPAYPAVNDFPAGRDPALTAAERQLLKDDLIATRQRAMEKGATATVEPAGSPARP